MRIAQIAPIIESVPPKKYGGTERVIHALTEELVKRGHDVTLFASGDSLTSAKLRSVTKLSLREANAKDLYGYNMYSLINVGLAYQMQNQFDIIHDHNSQNSPISLPLANISQTPVVMTVHGTLNGDYGFESAGKNGYEIYELYNKPYLVSISKKQQQVAPHLNFIGTVHHGLNMRSYPYSQNDQGYLLFVGRIHVFKGSDEKGLNHAIAVAKALDLPLKIAAKLDTTIPEDVTYFEQVIKPQLNGKIEYLGEIDEETRNRLMANAICLLHTINFEEPFGLTLIEAMACACPVVAFKKGSIPEIVIDGKTGFIVNNTSEAIKAVTKIKEIDRLSCREHALKQFSAEKMVSEYEKIYQQIIQSSQAEQVGQRFAQQLLSDNAKTANVSRLLSASISGKNRS